MTGWLPFWFALPMLVLPFVPVVTVAPDDKDIERLVKQLGSDPPKKDAGTATAKPASDDDTKTEEAIKALGGKVVRDAKTEGKPILGGVRFLVTAMLLEILAEAVAGETIVLLVVRAAGAVQQHLRRLPRRHLCQQRSRGQQQGR